VGDVVRTLAWGIKLKLHISGQRGLIVSVSGIDGSGKTFHIQSLVSAFQIAEVKAFNYWTRFGSLAQKNDLSRPGSGKVRISDTATSLSRRRQKLRHPVLRFGWLIYNLTGLILRYNWQVRLRRWLGGVVICDRYIYDAMVEISASLPDAPRLSRCAEWLLTRLSPRPDVAWLLDVPADLSVERQADENRSQASCEELSKQRSMYLALAQTYNLRVITTLGRPKETTSQVVRETLHKYFDEYGTWVNALLLSNPGQMNSKKGV
jgi:thymidylate kinase